jgi:hypothetical protein
VFCEVVEHRRGSFVRHDLFDVGDVLCIGAERVTMIQSYLNTKANRMKHAHINPDHPAVRAWLQTGNRFVHHLWSKRGGRWGVAEWDVRRADLAPYPAPQPRTSTRPLKRAVQAPVAPERAS